jgi:hypothetical protein
MLFKNIDNWKRKYAACRVWTHTKSNCITHIHEANTRSPINKQDTCGLPAAYKRLRLIGP